MNHLPPDVDRLLWEVAESQDANAFDDFEKRFPDLVGELGKRIQLVRELRDARGDGSRRQVPRFDRRVPTRIGPHPRAVLALCATLVVCLGLAAFAVTNRLVTQAPKLDPVPHVPTGPVTLPTPSYAGPVVTPIPVPKLSPPVNPTAEEPPHSDNLPLYLKPQRTVAFERAKLQIVILAVATSGGLQVEFAPNMTNPEIRMEYHNMSPLDILKDLGPRFNFTAFREGGNQILVVPKTDPNAPVLPPANGSGYAATIESVPDPDDSGTNKPRKLPSHIKSPS